MSREELEFEYIDGGPPFQPRRCVVAIPDEIPAGQRPTFLRALGVFLVREAERRRAAAQRDQRDEDDRAISSPLGWPTLVIRDNQGPR